jgi:hypothetical protein
VTFIEQALFSRAELVVAVADGAIHVIKDRFDQPRVYRPDDGVRSLCLRNDGRAHPVATHGFVRTAEIVELATVQHADEANALLAAGWQLLGHAAHIGAPPEFHLGRPAHVPETPR